MAIVSRQLYKINVSALKMYENTDEKKKKKLTHILRVGTTFVGGMFGRYWIFILGIRRRIVANKKRLRSKVNHLLK